MSHHFCSDGISFSFRFVIVRVLCHFSWSHGPRNDQCPRENLFAWLLTCSEFSKYHFLNFFFVQSMSLNIDMKIFRPSKCLDSTFWSCRFFWIFWKISNDVSPRKIFHSNSICSPPIPNNSVSELYLVKFFELSSPFWVCSWTILHLPQAKDGI